jgi:hypothetical protein
MGVLYPFKDRRNNLVFWKVLLFLIPSFGPFNKTRLRILNFYLSPKRGVCQKSIGRQIKKWYKFIKSTAKFTYILPLIFDYSHSTVCEILHCMLSAAYIIRCWFCKLLSFKYFECFLSNLQYSKHFFYLILSDFLQIYSSINAGYNGLFLIHLDISMAVVSLFAAFSWLERSSAMLWPL